MRMGRLVRDQGLWVGQYWTILYAQFLATLVLLFCAVEQRDSQDSSDILLDAMMGRDNIANLANVSIAADRLLDTLNVWQYVLLKHLSLVVYVATNIWVVVSWVRVQDNGWETFRPRVPAHRKLHQNN